MFEVHRLEPRIVLSAPVLEVLETSGIRHDNRLEFGEIPVDAVRTDIVTVRNRGDSALVLHDARIIHPVNNSALPEAFSLSRALGPGAADDIVLAKNESVEFAITYQPPSDDFRYTGELRIQTNIGTRHISLSGEVGEEQVRQKLDVFFLLDTTASMDRVFTSLAGALQTITSQLSSSGVDVDFGLGEFRDFTFAPQGDGEPLFVPDSLSMANDAAGRQYPYRLIEQIGASALSIASEVRGLDAEGGGDSIESGLEALYQVATAEGFSDSSGIGVADVDYTPAMIRARPTGWRSDASKVVIVATDNPMRDPKSNDWAPDGAHGLSDVLGAYRQLDARVVGLMIDSPLSTNNSALFEQLTTLARGTGAIGDVDQDGVATDPLVFRSVNSAEEIADALLGLVGAVQADHQPRVREDSGRSDDSRLEFVGANVGKPITQTFTIVNDGSVALGVASIVLTNPAFEIIGGDRANIAAGGARTFTVQLIGTGVGPITGAARVLTSDIVGGPLIVRLEADVFNAKTQPPVISFVSSQFEGRFIQGIEAQNEFSASVTDPDSGIAHVEFRIGSSSFVDTNGTDGWSASFDMGSANPNKRLVVVATDESGSISERYFFEYEVAERPDWLRNHRDNYQAVGVFNPKRERYEVTFLESLGLSTSFPVQGTSAALRMLSQALGGATSIDPGFEHLFHIPLDKRQDPRLKGSYWTFSLDLFGERVLTAEPREIEVGRSWSVALKDKGGSEGSFKLGGQTELVMSRFLGLTYNHKTTIEISLPIYQVKSTVASVPIPIGPIVTTAELGLDFAVTTALKFESQGTYYRGTMSHAGTKLGGEFALSPSISADYGLPADLLRGGLKATGSARVGVQAAFRANRTEVTWPASIDIKLTAEGVALGGFVSGEFEIAKWKWIDIPDLADYVFPNPRLASPGVSLLQAPAEGSIFSPAITTSGSTTYLAYLRAETESGPASVWLQTRDRDGNWSDPTLVDSSNTRKLSLAIGIRARTPTLAWVAEKTSAREASFTALANDSAVYWSELRPDGWSSGAVVPGSDFSTGLLPHSLMLEFSKGGTTGVLAYSTAQVSTPTFGTFFHTWTGTGWSDLDWTTFSREESLAVSRVSGGGFLFTAAGDQFVGQTPGRLGVGAISYAYHEGGEFPRSTVAFYTTPGAHIAGHTSEPLADGRVLIAWAEMIGGQSTIMSATFDPSTLEWSDERIAATGLVGAARLSLATGGGRAVLAYSALHEGRQRVFVQTIKEGYDGELWTNPIQLSQGKWAHSSPSVALSPFGEILVAQWAHDLYDSGATLKRSAFTDELIDEEGLQLTRISRRPNLHIGEAGLTLPTETSARPTQLDVAIPIVNSGVTATGSFRVAIVDEQGQVVISRRVMDLGAGETIIWRPTISAPGGEWEYTVILDDRGEVRELSEADNSIVARSGVLDASAAVVTVSPNRVTRGEGLTLVVRVPSDATIGIRRVAFYLDANGDGLADPSEFLGGEKLSQTRYRLQLSPDQTFELPYGRIAFLAVPTDEFRNLGAPIPIAVRMVDRLVSEAGRSSSAVVTDDGRVVNAVVNKDGRVLVFEEQPGGRVTVTTLTLGRSMPHAFEAVAFLDTSNANLGGIPSVVVATPRGVLLFSLSGSAWTGRNLSAELSKDTLVRNLSVYADEDGSSRVVGETAAGKLAMYVQDADDSALWSYQNITKSLTRAGRWAPYLEEFVTLGTSWGTEFVFGLDPQGRLWGLRQLADDSWSSVRLDQLTGIGRLSDSIATFETSWSAVTIGALDRRGRLWTVYWREGQSWQALDQSTLGAPRFAAGSLTGYFGGDGRQYFVGLDSNGETVAFWGGAGDGWSVTSLTAGFGAGRARPGAPLYGVSSPSRVQVIAGIDDSGSIMWLTARPGDPWKLRDVSASAVVI